MTVDDDRSRGAADEQSISPLWPDEAAAAAAAAEKSRSDTAGDRRSR